MKKNTTDFQITEKDIEATMHYLKVVNNTDATREDAIEFLEQHKSMAHIVAHKIVEQEKEQ